MSSKTSTEHLTHMYAHTYAQEITQNTYTPAHIYMHRYNTHICSITIHTSTPGTAQNTRYNITENKNTHIHCTQYAHNMHTHNTENRIQDTTICSTSTYQLHISYISVTYATHTYNNTIMQHREDNTEQNTENSTHISHAQDNAQPQRTVMHTYSFDIYHEYVAIKNSDTIELYTILK